MWWTKKVADPKLLAEIERLGRQLSLALQRKDEAEKQERETYTLYLTLKKEREDVEKKLLSTIREQTEADVFFLSAKIIFHLLSGTPKEDSLVSGLLQQQRHLQERLQSFSTFSQASPSGLSGLGGGLASFLGQKKCG